MKTLALLTLLIISGSAVGQMSNVNGFVGMDVLLPFNCSNDPNEVIWQKGERIVNAQTKDPISIDDSYVDRTQLFINKEKRNCSLLLRSLSTADAGVYTSYAIVSVDNGVWSSMSSEVNLTVSVMEIIPETENQTSEEISATAVSVSVPILVVMLILAVIILLTLLIKRYHRRNMETDSPAEKPMLQMV